MVNVFCVILCVIALDQVILLKINARSKFEQYGVDSSNEENSNEDDLHGFNSYERYPYGGNPEYYPPNPIEPELHGRRNEEPSYPKHDPCDLDRLFGAYSDHGRSNYWNRIQVKCKYPFGKSSGKKSGNAAKKRFDNPTTPQPSKCFLNLNTEYDLLIIFALIALNIPLSYCLYLSYQHYLTIKEIQRKRSQNTVKAMANSNKPFNVFLI